MEEYVQGQQCSRTSLSEHLNTPDLTPDQRQCCVPDDVPCDVCSKCPLEPIDAAERSGNHNLLGANLRELR